MRVALRSSVIDSGCNDNEEKLNLGYPSSSIPVHAPRTMTPRINTRALPEAPVSRATNGAAHGGSEEGAGPGVRVPAVPLVFQGPVPVVPLGSPSPRSFVVNL